MHKAMVPDSMIVVGSASWKGQGTLSEAVQAGVVGCVHAEIRIPDDAGAWRKSADA